MTSPSELGLRMRIFKTATRTVAESLAEGEPFREARGQAGIENLLLRFADVVVQPAELDGTLGQIVDHVGGLGIIVAGLPDAPHVDEIFASRLDLEFGISPAPHDRIADERDRNMGVAKETDARVLVGEAR